MTGGAPTFVSVVVPVFGAGEALRACLDALDAQTWPADQFEVLVVENGAAGEAGATAAGRPRVRVLHEPLEGSYAARNRGIGAARGEVIAFLDADCFPSPDWMERGVARIGAEPGCGFVAGRIRVFPREPSRPTAVELYEGVVSFRQEEYVRRRRFGATANLFTTREVLDRVGPFDPSLKSLGDVDFGVRVHGAGFRLVYAEEARVDHPARRTLREFLRRGARMAGGFRDLGRTGRWPLGRRLRYAAMGLPPAGAILRGAGLRGPGERLKVLGVAAAVVGIRFVTLVRLALGARPGR